MGGGGRRGVGVQRLPICTASRRSDWLELDIGGVIDLQALRFDWLVTVEGEHGSRGSSFSGRMLSA